jgi:hypothetical protein
MTKRFTLGPDHWRVRPHPGLLSGLGSVPWVTAVMIRV